MLRAEPRLERLAKPRDLLHVFLSLPLPKRLMNTKNSSIAKNS